MNKPSAVRTVLQIQPFADSRDEWHRLAVREDLMFEVIELSLPPALTESGRLSVCREWYRKSGRARSIHGAFIDINPASGDPALQELSRRRCRESCDSAVAVGARNVVFHSSCLPFLTGSYLDKWAGSCAAFFEELAEEYDLDLFIENSQDVSPKPIFELMKRISNKKVGVCLDFGHVNYSRTPLELWLDQLGDRIGYLHLSDNLGLWDDHMPLGDGIVDWEEAHRFWKSKGKSMTMTLEVGGIDGVLKSLDYLREHQYFGVERA